MRLLGLLRGRSLRAAALHLRWLLRQPARLPVEQPLTAGKHGSVVARAGLPMQA